MGKASVQFMMKRGKTVWSFSLKLYKLRENLYILSVNFDTKPGKNLVQQFLYSRKTPPPCSSNRDLINMYQYSDLNNFKSKVDVS
jgi:hypothetical protein